MNHLCCAHKPDGDARYATASGTPEIAWRTELPLDAERIVREHGG